MKKLKMIVNKEVVNKVINMIRMKKYVWKYQWYKIVHNMRIFINVKFVNKIIIF